MPIPEVEIPPHRITSTDFEAIPYGWLFNIYFELEDGTKAMETGSGRTPAFAGHKAFENLIRGLIRHAETGMYYTK